MTTTNKVDSGASMSVPTADQKRFVIVGATGMAADALFATRSITPPSSA
jgi:hypothetical protein